MFPLLSFRAGYADFSITSTSGLALCVTGWCQTLLANESAEQGVPEVRRGIGSARGPVTNGVCRSSAAKLAVPGDQPRTRLVTTVE